MVRNPGVRLKCDHQSSQAWLRSWERASATTADFCDAGGAAELAVKALFPHMQRWAYNLQASHCWLGDKQPVSQEALLLQINRWAGEKNLLGLET